MPGPNPHGSLKMYNPHSSDENDYTDLADRPERTAKLQAFYNEHAGHQIHVRHAKSGEVRLWDITPISPFSRAGWVLCEHILFGMWRLATPDEVEAFQKQTAAKREQVATAQARSMMAATAAVISEFSMRTAGPGTPQSPAAPVDVDDDEGRTGVLRSQDEPGTPQSSAEP